MSVPKGRKTRVEIASTYASAIILSGITNANPAVLSAAAHGLLNGAIGYISLVSGMEQLLGQAISVDAPTAGTFAAEGVNTTDYGTFVSASLIPVATWLTLAKSTSYTIGGGAGSEIDTTVLLDEFDQSETGNLAAQTVQVSGFSDFQLPAMQTLRTAAIGSKLTVFRLSLENGERRVFCGVPTLPGESMSVKHLATGDFTINVKGQVLFLGAA